MTATTCPICGGVLELRVPHICPGAPECTATAASAPYGQGAQPSLVSEPVRTMSGLVLVSAECALTDRASSSARACAFDATRLLLGGNELGAVRWALRSLEHSVGVFSPVYRDAVRDAVALFPLESLDTFRVLGGK